MKNFVVQLAKAPLLNKVKTRMQPTLTALQCCELHKTMTRHNVESSFNVGGWNHVLSISESHTFFDELSEDTGVPLELQKTGDLGERLAHIADQYLSAGVAENLILIGSDCPFLNSDLYHTIFNELETPEADSVIVPALDGGYVALGMNKNLPALFNNIDWGSERVLKQTLDRANADNINIKSLAPLPDVDRPEDLKHLSKIVQLSFTSRLLT